MGNDGQCCSTSHSFSIVGMAYQSQNVNNGIPDDRVARSTKYSGTYQNWFLVKRADSRKVVCQNRQSLFA